MGNSLGDVFVRSNNTSSSSYKDQIAPIGNFNSIDDAETLRTSKLGMVRVTKLFI